MVSTLCLLPQGPNDANNKALHTQLSGGVYYIIQEKKIKDPLYLSQQNNT